MMTDLLKQMTEIKQDTEVFYTGGGVWLSAYQEDETHYYIVEAWEGGYHEDVECCLTYYDHSDEDDDIEYPCQNMLWSKELKDLSVHQFMIWQVLHSEMNAELKRYGAR